MSYPSEALPSYQEATRSLVPRDEMPAVNSRHSKVVYVVTSIAIAVITAIAAYFMLSYGLNRLDFAFTSMDAFVGGFMAYMGVAYGITAFVNACLACSQACGSSLIDEEEHKNFTAMQAGISLLAPLAFVPAACCFALQTGTTRAAARW